MTQWLFAGEDEFPVCPMRAPIGRATIAASERMVFGTERQAY
jgi:hypothetical protein